MINEHIKGSRSKQQVSDEGFEDFKTEAYQIYNRKYDYEDFISMCDPVTVINTETGLRHKQRIQHILKGRLPSEEKRRKYTKENCQSYSDLQWKGRFVIDVNTFKDSNSYVSIYDNETEKSYIQLYHHHIAGSLPKEISYSNISRKESSLIQELKILFPDKELITGHRPKWLKRQELDIYFPEMGIAIEYNGLIFHHSEKNPTNPFLNKTYKEEDYHLNKSQLCLDNNIKLIHIFEHEVLSLNLKELIEKYQKSDISFNGVLKEHVNTRTLLVATGSEPHDVMICKPNVIF